jgi:phosphatidate cytidylyltransferase
VENRVVIYGLWQNPRYVETFTIIMGALLLLTPLVYLLKAKKGAAYTTAWASLKSWLFVGPLLFAAFALPKPFPLLFVTWMGVLSAKSYFQMVGMYHRSWFVWITYLAIFGLGHIIYHGHLEFYDLSPMIFLFIIALIPLLRNSATHMIQYLALSLLAFIFWGWSYMHMGRLLTFEGGQLMVLYLYLLTEVSENTTWAVSKLFGRVKPFSRITSKVTLEGMLAGLLVTMLVAWGMRHLLPDRSEQFWVAAGLIAAVFGRMGDLIINVIRRDLGIKDTGVFIIGRDGIITRVDKLIFVGPMYFYLYIYLQQVALP